MCSRTFCGSGDWEEAIKPASVRIRIAMAVLDVVLLTAGVALITLGIHLNRYVTTMSDNKSDLPHIWSLGVLPIILGAFGLICLLLGGRKLVVLWCLVSVVLGVVGFSTFVIFNFFDPQIYGINIQIFGNCADDGTHCKCLWNQTKNTVGVLRSSCDYVRTTSTLYLALIVVFIVCTSTIVICVILGCVLTFCLKLCIPRDDDNFDLHTTIHGINMRVHHSSRRSHQQETVLRNQRYALVAADENEPNHVNVITNSSAYNEADCWDSDQLTKGSCTRLSRHLPLQIITRKDSQLEIT